MSLRTRFKLWKLRYEQRAVERTLNRLAREAGKRLDDCTGEPWYSDHMNVVVGLDGQMTEEISNDLMYQAQELYVPTPGWSDKAKWESEAGNRYLTPEAMTELRTAIRKERAERRVVFEWWVKVVGGAIGILTGLVGALIGLVAVWKK